MHRSTGPAPGTHACSFAPKLAARSRSAGPARPWANGTSMRRHDASIGRAVTPRAARPRPPGAHVPPLRLMRARDQGGRVRADPFPGRGPSALHRGRRGVDSRPTSAQQTPRHRLVPLSRAKWHSSKASKDQESTVQRARNPARTRGLVATRAVGTRLGAARGKPPTRCTQLAAFLVAVVPSIDLLVVPGPTGFRRRARPTSSLGACPMGRSRLSSPDSRRA